MILRADESQITAAWIAVDGRVVGDESDRRIREALQAELIKLATRAGGWEALFRSTADGRLWVLDYPHSEWHGGGPPRLTLIQPAEAKARFGDLLLVSPEARPEPPPRQ